MVYDPSGGRKSDFEARAPVDLALDTYLPVVSLDDPLHQRQAQPYSAAGPASRRISAIKAVENVGDVLGVVSLHVKGCLERFKEFIEQRGRETEAWRGQV